MKLKDIKEAIAAQLGIESLNEMQRSMSELPPAGTFILLAPTGSGKTVAFAIPLLKGMPAPDGRVRAVVMAPSRELVLQIAEVIRKLAQGWKTVALYGGHSMRDEAASVAVTPDIIVATPGRLLDHINRGHLDLSAVSRLVIDEYDKALELGFADEMRRVCRRLTGLGMIILTSATPLAEIPSYLPTNYIKVLDFGASDTPRHRMQVVHVESPARDKLDTLVELLRSLPQGKVIVFVNHRDAAERVHKALRSARLPAGLYHGGLDQNDRENALELLANGSTPILVATDLGARGLDIPAVSAVVHYHLPVSVEAWTHRNGRTARQDASGEVYVITAEGENIPEYINWDREYVPTGRSAEPIRSDSATLYFNAGRKEKISKGDIVGFLTAKGGLTGGEIGRIALRDHSALVAVLRDKVAALLEALAPHKIKNTRVRITRMA